MPFTSQLIRQQTIQLIRQFFLDRHFTEVDVPLLLPSLPLEPNLYSLKTTWTQRQQDFYLITSPESSLKKLIAAGIGNCFSIAKVWRDLENIGPTHNLEFSMLEWYEMGKNYTDIAKTTQKLISYCYQGISKKLNKRITNSLDYQGTRINLCSPWHEFTLQELFSQFAHMDLSSNLTLSSIKKTAAAKGYNVDGVISWEPLYTQIFVNEVESQLPTDKPIIIYDYPTRQSPLCLPCPNTPGFSQRFEFYIGGIEIGNAYTENTDAKLLRQSFEQETRSRRKQRLPSHPTDTGFIAASAQMPPCAGIGLGVDRLAMLFADTADINDVLFFPTAKLLK